MAKGLIKKEFENDSLIIGNQASSFVELVSPYMAVQENEINDYLDKDSVNRINGFRFFKLSSCITENIDELDKYMQDKMNKLYTAIHSLNAPIIYGIVSECGRTNLIIGVEDKQDKEVIRSVLGGLMTGVELSDYTIPNDAFITKTGKGGVISSVPAVKIGEERQNFDISALMRSLNGYNYSVLFVSKPYSLDAVQDTYGKIIDVRDRCFQVSKRNIARQQNESRSDSTQKSNSKSSSTTTSSTTGKNKGFNFLLWNRSKNKSTSISSNEGFSVSFAETVANTIGSSETIALDVQNGFALELMEYCDKAIERLKQGQNLGLWGTAISYHAENELAANIIKACLCGELSKSTADILPLKAFDIEGKVAIPKLSDKPNKLLAPITSYELGMISTLPYESVPDFELKQGKQYPMISSSDDNGITIGKVSDGHRPIDKMEFKLSEKDLNKHTFVCGITGSGKTTTVKRILLNCNKPFMVIESAKKEYRNLVDKNPIVYTLGKPELNCIRFNPFYIQYGTNLQTHIDYLKDLFNASFSFYGPMPYILEKCLHNVYKKKGWNLTLGYHPLLINLKNYKEVFSSEYMREKYLLDAHKQLFPTMIDLKNEVKRYIEQEMQYDGEVGGNIKTAILARLESLCVGAKGYMFNTTECIDMEDMMNKNVVFELEGLADDSDKAFCVGLLVIFINEYRQVYKEEKSLEKIGLQHLLVIEEAHRLLKNVETERSSENMGNPKGKAVEHFTNMIAEMRSYGQGVIIAEQIPSKLAPDVIKNSSNKIIQRVVSADDQNLVANTIGMKQEDAVLLGSLKTGMGLCHKEGMSLPIYVDIDNVENAIVNDYTLQSEDVYDKINYSLIKEATSDVIDTIGLKILNSILANSKEEVIISLNYAKELMDKELNKKDISLIMCSNKKEIEGVIISENLIKYLTNGVYSLNELMTNDLYTYLKELCVKCLIEKIDNVRKKLKEIYKEDCRNRCIRIVASLISKKMEDKVNVKGSIEQYFYTLDEKLLDDIANAIKKGGQKQC